MPPLHRLGMNEPLSCLPGDDEDENNKRRPVSHRREDSGAVVSVTPHLVGGPFGLLHCKPGQPKREYVGRDMTGV